MRHFFGLAGTVLSLIVLANPAASGQSWYGLQENGLEPEYRNQGCYGTCWAFGTMASVETNLIKQGLASQSTVNLSESDLAWHSGYGDYINPLNGGGSYMFSSAYFARGDGPLLESEAPYPNDFYRNSTTPTPVSERTSRPAASYYVRDIEWLHSEEDIKYALLNHGAVSTCWAYNTGTWYGDSGHWNASSTYQAGAVTGQPNHSVAIVGWDDDWVTAGGTGAWLIRNSWGNSVQHFGMSYNDFYCGHDLPDTGAQNMGAVSFNNVEVNTYQQVYYHNDLGWTGQQPYAYAFNHFTADQDGQLQSVSIFTTEDDVEYTVSVFTRFEDGTLSELAATTSGSMTHEGFHTIDLPSLVSLMEGQDFYIELQTSNCQQACDGDSEVTVVTGEGGAPSYVYTYASFGESFYSSDGINWTDLQTLDASANFAINALTIAVPEPSTCAMVLVMCLSLGWHVWIRRRAGIARA